MLISASLNGYEYGEPPAQLDPETVLETTAVMVRAVLEAGGRVLTTASGPVLRRMVTVAAEQPRDEPPISLYGVAWGEGSPPPELVDHHQVRFSGGAPDEMLAYLRHIMIEDARPVAGVFIGGGDDVTTEYGLLRNLLGRAAGARGFAHSGPPLYPIALPGGAAAKMEAPRRLRSLLWQGGMAAVAQGIVQDIGEQLGLAGPGRSGVGLGW